MKVEEGPVTPASEKKSNLKIWTLIVLGLLGLLIGGKLVVDNAVLVATDMGVSQKIMVLLLSLLEHLYQNL
jgi:cation:H+ antiporter